MIFYLLEMGLEIPISRWCLFWRVTHRHWICCNLEQVPDFGEWVVDHLWWTFFFWELAGVQETQRAQASISTSISSQPQKKKPKHKLASDGRRRRRSAAAAASTGSAARGSASACANYYYHPQSLAACHYQQQKQQQKQQKLLLHEKAADIFSRLDSCSLQGLQSRTKPPELQTNGEEAESPGESTSAKKKKRRILPCRRVQLCRVRYSRNCLRSSSLAFFPTR